jgi:hypothetical protein
MIRARGARLGLYHPATDRSNRRQRVRPTHGSEPREVDGLSTEYGRADYPGAIALPHPNRREARATERESLVVPIAVRRVDNQA